MRIRSVLLHAMSASLLLSCGESSSGPTTTDEQSDASLPMDGAVRDGRADSATETDAALSCTTDSVDLLVVIDNSATMAEEQKKLLEVLPNLVIVLTTGFYTPKPAGTKPDFPPVKSLHLAVVSSDMGLHGIQGVEGCGNVSFDPTAPDPTNPAATQPASNTVRIDKPKGDDGVFNTSVAVAIAGIQARPPNAPLTTPVATVVPPDARCADALASLPAGQRFIEVNAGSSDGGLAAKQLSCLATLGKNGCGFEQQLDAMLKALTPSTSAVTFAGGSKGHGDLENRGFLRPDAVLAIVHLTDEEDCSIPDTPASKELFNPLSAAITDDINVRCGLSKYASLLHSVESRYITGVKALKNSALVDNIIFMGIVGASMKPGDKVYSGAQQLSALLGNPDMQLTARPIQGSPRQELTPACVSFTGAGLAVPGRRFIELAKAFGDNGAISSICEDEFGSALNVLTKKIANRLSTDRCATNTK